MVKTKTRIEEQLQKKTNQELVDTLIAAKKKEKWLPVASLLSRSRRDAVNVNLNQIDLMSKEGEVVVIPGKVLSQGEVSKKIKIVAFRFSEKAREKLSKSKVQTSSIIDEIKKNPDAKEIRILTNLEK